VLLGGFAAALAIRILFLAAPNDRYDLHSFRIVADILERGGDFYRETTRYNYSPVWAGAIRALDGISRSLSISLDRAVTTLLLLADAATALLILRISRRRGADPTRALFASLLFFANPVSVVTSSRLAMFDNVSIVFLLLAVAAMESVPVRKTGVVAALSASLLVKHVTWFHPLLLPRKREPRVGLPAALVPYLLFFLSFLPYRDSWDRIRTQVFGYQSLGEPWGTEPLRRLTWMPSWGTTAICAAAALAAALWLRAREVEFARASLLLFLVVLLFAPGIAVYYFVWPIALGALAPSAGYFVYTAVVTLFLIHSPDAFAIELAHLPGWSGPWWALAFWLLWEMRRIASPRPARAAAAAESAPG
jgi:hypothetical protein